MFRRQKDISAEEFNEDHEYKNILNEVYLRDPDGSDLEALLKAKTSTDLLIVGLFRIKPAFP